MREGGKEFTGLCRGLYAFGTDRAKSKNQDVPRIALMSRKKRSTFGGSRWSPRGTVVLRGKFSLFVVLLMSMEVGI
jgi:hypothetical protein